MRAELPVIKLAGDAVTELLAMPKEAFGEVFGALFGSDRRRGIDEVSVWNGGGAGWWRCGDVCGEVHIW